MYKRQAYTLAIHAATLLFGRQYEEAKDAVHRALEIEPDNVVASYTLAWILGATGDGEGAVAAGDRLLEVTGAPPAFRAIHALGLGCAGRRAEAEDILSDLEGLPPGDVTGDVWRCLAAIGAGRLDEGRDYFVEAMRRSCLLYTSPSPRD